MTSPMRHHPRRPLVLVLAIVTAAACIKTSHGQALFQEIEQVLATLQEIWPEYRNELGEQVKEFRQNTVYKIRDLMDTIICNKAVHCRKKGPRQAIDLVPRRRQDNSASFLIMENSQHEKDIFDWVNSLDNMMKYYDCHRDSSRSYSDEYKSYCNINVKDCSEDNRAILANGETCYFDPKWLGSQCSSSELYGYLSKSPCIIAQLNNLGSWTPDVYETIEELPTDMPEDLKTHIKEQTSDNGGRVPQMLWLNCKGQTSDDDEYIGEVEYTPWRGFPAYYFPHTDPENYLGPLVGVRFVALTKNVLINIECRIYAKNISQSRSDNDDNDSVFGVMNFEVFID